MDQQTPTDNDHEEVGNTGQSVPVENVPAQNHQSPGRVQAPPRLVPYREKAGNALPPDLPTITPLDDEPRKVLQKATPTLIGLHHEAINRFRHYTELAESQGVLNVAAYCTSQMAKHVLKELELGVGRSLNIKAHITSQAQVPNYDDLPQEERAKYEQERKLIEAKAHKVE